MSLSDFPKAVVGIVVAVLIVSALAIPVISNYSDSTYVAYNNSSGHLAKIIDDDVTVTFDSGTVTVDGVAVAVTSNAKPFVISDTVTIGWQTDYANIYGLVSGTLSKVYNIKSMTISIDASEHTIACSSITYTEGHTGASTVTLDTYTWAFVQENTGGYEVLNGSRTGASTENVYVASIDNIYSFSVNSSDAYSLHGATVKHNGQVDEDVTATITLSSIPGISGVMSFVYTNNTTTSKIIISDDDTDLSLGDIIVPNKVTGEKTDQVTFRTILNIVPLLLVVGIVIGAVSLITIKKN